MANMHSCCLVRGYALPARSSPAGAFVSAPGHGDHPVLPQLMRKIHCERAPIMVGSVLSNSPASTSAVVLMPGAAATKASCGSQHNRGFATAFTNSALVLPTETCAGMRGKTLFRAGSPRGAMWCRCSPAAAAWPPPAPAARARRPPQCGWCTLQRQHEAVKILSRQQVTLVRVVNTC